MKVNRGNRSLRAARDRLAALRRKATTRRPTDDPAPDEMVRRRDALDVATRQGERSLKGMRAATDLTRGILKR